MYYYKVYYRLTNVSIVVRWLVVAAVDADAVLPVALASVSVII